MSDPLDETAPSDDPAPAPALTAGAQLGKYKLVRLLGAGGMGVVWAARDPDLDREVALKLLRSAQAAPDLRARLLREARAMARLKHPNVLTVYEVDSDASRDYIAMELVDGASLDAWLADKPREADIRAALLAAGRGLAAAHAAGLVHRDFKPHNVLRSRDGRVLVTDFGLARGLADDVALDKTLPPDASVDVLASPLTRTGALIGTPAYMAPEQFEGTPPDPRTDQFGFCVTAWQALTGERPYRGATIEELRRAASSGEPAGDPPRALRDVLVRGLSPDPAKRWPSMDALLAAFERAVRPRQWWRFVVPAFAVVMASLLAFSMRQHHTPSACPASGAEEIAKVWTPASRAELVRRAGTGPNVELTARALDEFRTHWVASYDAACAAPQTQRMIGRIGCLLGERDQLGGLTQMLDSVTPEMFHAVELWGVLPRIEACEGDAPVAPPLIPDDPAVRQRVTEMRREIVALRLSGNPTPAEADAVIARAKEVGWEPIVAEAHEAIADQQQKHGRHDLALVHLEAAAELAQQLHDFRTEATARLGLIESEMAITADPTDPLRLEHLVGPAKAAIHNAGDDPVLEATWLGTIANAALARGELDAAVTDHWRALRTQLKADLLRQASGTASQEALALIARGSADDLDEADRELRLVYDRIQTTHLPVRVPDYHQLLHMLAEVSRLRGDAREEHRWGDLEGAPSPSGATIAAHGIVRRGGHPVAGARVVAWRGELFGDAERAYVELLFDGAIATTDADGRFTLQAPKDGAIIAELAGARSMLRAIDATPELELLPTHTAHATTQTPVRNIVVMARYAVTADTAWYAAVSPAANGSVELGGLPAGDATLIVRGDYPPRELARTVVVGPLRDTNTYAWPVGPTIDVIVRVPADRVCVVHTMPKSRRALDALLEHGDSACADVRPIGIEEATEAGRRAPYRRDDLHVRLRDNAPPSVACAVHGEAIECRSVTLPAEPSSTVAVVITK